jgi:hypothetical protein
MPGSCPSLPAVTTTLARTCRQREAGSDGLGVYVMELPLMGGTGLEMVFPVVSHHLTLHFPVFSLLF